MGLLSCIETLCGFEFAANFKIRKCNCCNCERRTVNIIVADSPDAAQAAGIVEAALRSLEDTVEQLPDEVEMPTKVRPMNLATTDDIEEFRDDIRAGIRVFSSNCVRSLCPRAVERNRTRRKEEGFARLMFATQVVKFGFWPCCKTQGIDLQTRYFDAQPLKEDEQDLIIDEIQTILEHGSRACAIWEKYLDINPTSEASINALFRRDRITTQERTFYKQCLKVAATFRHCSRFCDLPLDIKQKFLAQAKKTTGDDPRFHLWITNHREQTEGYSLEEAVMDVGGFETVETRYAVDLEAAGVGGELEEDVMVTTASQGEFGALSASVGPDRRFVELSEEAQRLIQRLSYLETPRDDYLSAGLRRLEAICRNNGFDFEDVKTNPRLSRGILQKIQGDIEELREFDPVIFHLFKSFRDTKHLEGQLRLAQLEASPYFLNGSAKGRFWSLTKGKRERFYADIEAAFELRDLSSEAMLILLETAKEYSRALRDRLRSRHTFEDWINGMSTAGIGVPLGAGSRV